MRGPATATLGAGALGVDEGPGVDRLAQQVSADPGAADGADDQRALGVVAQPLAHGAEIGVVGRVEGNGVAGGGEMLERPVADGRQAGP